MNKKRLNKIEFDILDILLETGGATTPEIASRMRDRGYDITNDELNQIFDEIFKEE